MMMGMSWCDTSNPTGSTGGDMPMQASSTGASIQCEPGTMLTDMGTCQTCPAGTFAGTWNSKKCRPCPTGTSSTSGSASCYDPCTPIHSTDAISLTAAVGTTLYNLSFPKDHAVDVEPMAMDLLSILSISKPNPHTVLTFDMDDMAFALNSPYKVWGETKAKRTVLTCTKAGAAATTSMATIGSPAQRQLFGANVVNSMIDQTGANRICDGDSINIVQGNAFLDVVNQSRNSGFIVYCDNPKSKTPVNPKPKPTTFIIHKY